MWIQYLKVHEHVWHPSGSEQWTAPSKWRSQKHFSGREKSRVEARSVERFERLDLDEIRSVACGRYSYKSVSGHNHRMSIRMQQMKFHRKRTYYGLIKAESAKNGSWRTTGSYDLKQHGYSWKYAHPLFSLRKMKQLFESYAQQNFVSSIIDTSFWTVAKRTSKNTTEVMWSFLTSCQVSL